MPRSEMMSVDFNKDNDDNQRMMYNELTRSISSQSIARTLIPKVSVLK